uniref:Uncharacterized protein n=1 Tax=Arundo donax TaxID=35708 RepID=A0A0A8ZIL5_ARUDO
MIIITHFILTILNRLSFFRCQTSQLIITGNCFAGKSEHFYATRRVWLRRFWTIII